MFEIDWSLLIQGDKNSSIVMKYFRFHLPRNKEGEVATFQFYDPDIMTSIWYNFKDCWEVSEGEGCIYV